MPKLSGTNLANSSAKNKRAVADFYPTPPEVTIALLELLKLTPTDIWEPACGDGAMSQVLESYGHTVFSSDIRVTEYTDLVSDFLETETDTDWIITNPPFSASEKFIRHALSVTDNVAMLMKSQYWHAKGRLNLFAESKPTYVLPLTWRPDFLNGARGGSPTMEVAWTVWTKEKSSCRYIPLPKPKLII